MAKRDRRVDLMEARWNSSGWGREGACEDWGWESGMGSLAGVWCGEVAVGLGGVWRVVDGAVVLGSCA